MQHLDEGTIHAWLDGQLPRYEAEAVEAHVAECRQCADAVAEARGLIAASSRILMALDGMPRDVLPKQAPSGIDADVPRDVEPILTPVQSRVEQRARRRWFNGASLAAAAMIVVAVGTVTVMRADRRTAESRATAPTASAAATPGPSADSSASSAVAQSAGRSESPAPPVPAPATPAAKPLGGPSVATSQRRELASSARNEVARGGRQEAAQNAAPPPARESFAERTAEQRRDVAAAGVPAAPVTRAQVAEPMLADRRKTVDDLAKDAKVASDQIRIRGATSIVSDSSGNARRAVGTSAAVTTGAIRGRVSDGNNTGLGSVFVSAVGTSVGVTTSDDGEFTLGGLAPGTYRIVVRRIGYMPSTREVAVTAGQTATADVVLQPSTLALEQVVVTGSAEAKKSPRGRAAAGAQNAPAAPTPDTQPLLAAQSSAVGCYELGVTPGPGARSGFLLIPRRIALDAEVVPAKADGVWYRARDLARTGALPNGLWRPSGADIVELEWTSGSRTTRVQLSGAAGSMMRGSIEEIDRTTATGEGGTVVAVRHSCDS